MAYIAVNGEIITSTTSETEIYMEMPSGTLNMEQLVTLELVSGSVQFAVGETVISRHTTYSTAGDKTLRTVNNSNRSLRCLGTATFRIAW